MSTSIANAVEELTQKTTDLLDSITMEKQQLDEAVTAAELAANRAENADPVQILNEAEAKVQAAAGFAANSQTQAMNSAADRLLSQQAALTSAVALAAKDTIALGLASVADNQTFWVRPNATDGLTRFTCYLRTSSSTQTLIGSLALGTELDDRVSTTIALRNTARAPLMQLGTQIQLWVESGKIASANGLSDSLIGQINSALVAPLINSIDSTRLRNATRVPLAQAGLRIPIWASSQGVGFSVLEPNTLAYIKNTISPTLVTSQPISTDGRTLRKWRTKAGKFRANVANTVLRIGTVGDSWADLKNIPQFLLDKLSATYARSSDGYISFNPAQVLSGITFVRSGWTDYVPGNGTPARSCGPDGKAIYATGTSATVNVSGLTGSDFTLGFWDGNGTFRYRIDGGAWTSVVGGSTNAVKTLSIATGLSVGNHTFDIDLTGNTGTVEIYFLLSERPATNGVTLFKMGCGGQTGRVYSAVASHIAQWSSILALDLLLIFLGTNDSRTSVTSSNPTNLGQGVIDLAAAHKSANTNLGIIMVVPPPHGEAVSPGVFSDYWQAASDSAAIAGIECYRACNTWADFITENSDGQWGDTYHLSDSGAYRLVAELLNQLIRGA